MIRADFWRREIGRADTPREWYCQAHRWLLSMTARAEKTRRQAEANAAYIEAGQALADVAARLKERLSRD